MTQDLDKIKQIKEAAEADLLQRPGVTGVDVGYKYVGGQRTNEIVIRVHVAEKKDVPSDQKIPKTIEGVKTDVIKSRFEVIADTNKYDPLLGGISIGTTATDHAGTMGAIVIDNTDTTRLALSNYHVVCLSDGTWRSNYAVTQPEGQFPAPHIGFVKRAIMDGGTDAQNPGEVDCSVVTIQGEWPFSTRESTAAIVKIGGVTGITAAYVGGNTPQQVRKRGRTTELTYGTVDGVNMTHIADFSAVGLGIRYFKNQISIAPDLAHNTMFADHGDSGSVVVDSTGAVIGLLFTADIAAGRGTLNPINTVLDKLSVSMAVEGVGGYDLRSSADRSFAFDYDHSGKLDHLVLYRPGAGVIYILKKSGENFSQVFSSGNGIGGYDLKSSNDQVFAFDYDHSGKLDHLVLYRPGAGVIYILKNDGGNFSTVSPSGGNGIGGYDLKSPADRAFAFDYNHSGNLDHLVLYRPGTGTIWILRNSNGTFTPTYHQGDPGSGIGGFDLKSSLDQVCAFDYDHTGLLDHLILYRPGAGVIYIVKNSGGNFSTVSPSGADGIGGYNLKSPADRAFAFDYDGLGKRDHLVLYRPGTGTIWILRNSNGTFTPIYHQGDPGIGIGGYDLKSTADQVFAFDYKGLGTENHLALYRPGGSTFWIIEESNGQWTPVYHSVWAPASPPK